MELETFAKPYQVISPRLVTIQMRLLLFYNDYLPSTNDSIRWLRQNCFKRLRKRRRNPPTHTHTHTHTEIGRNHRAEPQRNPFDFAFELANRPSTASPIFERVLPFIDCDGFSSGFFLFFFWQNPGLIGLGRAPATGRRAKKKSKKKKQTVPEKRRRRKVATKKLVVPQWPGQIREGQRTERATGWLAVLPISKKNTGFIKKRKQ